jgi:hypothetical protein
VSVKLPGTDLLRRDALLAPAFLESQYANPAHPLERCAVYDAGSRAFCLPEYLHDVLGYWQEVAAAAGRGVGYRELLAERCPRLDPERFGEVSLAKVAANRAEALRAAI